MDAYWFKCALWPWNTDVVQSFLKGIGIIWRGKEENDLRSSHDCLLQGKKSSHADLSQMQMPFSAQYICRFFFRTEPEVTSMHCRCSSWYFYRLCPDLHVQTSCVRKHASSCVITLFSRFANSLIMWLPPLGFGIPIFNVSIVFYGPIFNSIVNISILHPSPDQNLLPWQVP